MQDLDVENSGRSWKKRKPMTAQKRMTTRNTDHYTTQQPPVDTSKQYGLMDAGSTRYSDAIDELNKKVIRNFFTEPDVVYNDEDKQHSVWNEVNHEPKKAVMAFRESVKMKRKL